MVAVPLGTVIAIYLSEFAPHRVREFVKPLLELLIGVPTVVFGYFALLSVTPMLQKILPDLPGFNMLGPGIVIGIMITPYISSLAEDAMRAVPMTLREGAYAMGATRFRNALTSWFPPHCPASSRRTCSAFRAPSVKRWWSRWRRASSRTSR